MTANSAMPSGPDEAYTLLEILADPAKSKQRLDELVAQEKLLREATDALNEARTEHEAARTNALSAMGAAKAHQAMLDAQRADQERAARDLASSLSEHKVRDAALTAKISKTDSEHAARAVALQRHEDNLTAAEKDFEQRKTALEAKEADYQRRIGKLKELAA